MRVFIQDRDIGRLESLERDLKNAGHEPVVIYSMIEILELASNPDLAPDVVVAEALVIDRTLRRLSESTAAMLRDLMTDRLLVATGESSEALPMKVGAQLPLPFNFSALNEVLVSPPQGTRNRRNETRKAWSAPVDIHLHNGGTYGPYSARFMDLSMGGACLQIPPGGQMPIEGHDTTVDLWVHSGHLEATRLHGRLAWTSSVRSDRGTKVGVEFFELTEVARSRLESALIR